MQARYKWLLLPPAIALILFMGPLRNVGGPLTGEPAPQEQTALDSQASEEPQTTQGATSTENPQAIIDEILAGIPAYRVASTFALVDRTRAIETAVGRARDGDVVLIAGKGHEPYQIIGTSRRPFDDRVVARGVLRRELATA